MQTGKGSKAEDFVEAVIVILETSLAEYGTKSSNMSHNGVKKVVSDKPPVAWQTCINF